MTIESYTSLDSFLSWDSKHYIFITIITVSYVCHVQIKSRIGLRREC